MNTIQVADKTYTIKGELSGGTFYLEGPRGGVVFAKVHPCGTYTFENLKGGTIYNRDGVLETATRSQLA